MAKCPKTKRSYGVRAEQMEDGDWWRTWSFESDDTRAAREGYDTNTIEGNLTALDTYPGCPYCGSRSFFYCGCGKISCGGPTGVDYTCPWCGQSHLPGICICFRFYDFGIPGSCGKKDGVSENQPDVR